MPTEHRLRPRKIPRQPRARETRARILDAAREVFSAHGYAGGTTNRIAAAAGLSVGSLYQYFPNKDAILVELVREHLADGTRQLLEAVGPEPRPVGPEAVEELVHRAVATLVRVHLADRRLHQVLFEESPRPPSLLAELHDLEDGLAAAVADRLRAAGLGLDDPELAARIAVTTIESLVHRLVATERPIDPDRLTTETTRLVAGYLTSASR